MLVVGRDRPEHAPPLSPRVLRRPAAAHRHRPGPRPAPQGARRRRAGQLARRVGAGADPRPAELARRAVPPRPRARVPRPRRDPQPVRARPRAPRRTGRRARSHRGGVRRVRSIRTPSDCSPLSPACRDRDSVRPRRTSTCCATSTACSIRCPSCSRRTPPNASAASSSLDTTNWEFYTEWGLGYDDFVELLGEGRARAQAVVDRHAVPRRRPGDRQDSGRPGTASTSSRPATSRGIEAEALDATRHWLDRHGIDADTITLAQDKTSVIDRLGLDPSSCVAVDDGPHHIEAFESVGVFGIVLDRWGSYRGDHPTAGDLERRRRPHRRVVDSAVTHDRAAPRRADRRAHRPRRSRAPGRRDGRCGQRLSRLGAAVRRRLLHGARRGTWRTSHNPLVGAWSMGSREVGTWLNNLGPLQLDVLAPFTKLDPYWGTAVGVAATNIAAIVGVWLVSRRILGPIGVVGAMAATVLLELNEGSLMLIEARQQLALVLPMWCTLWLAAATWMGRRWALPWLALAASFVLQTHFTYAYQTVAVAGAATIAFVVHHRRDLASVRRPIDLSAAVVTALCWVAAAVGSAGRQRQCRRRARPVGRIGSGRSACRGACASSPSRRSSRRSSPLARWATCCARDRGRRCRSPCSPWRCGRQSLVGLAIVMLRRHRGLAAMAAIGATALGGSVVAAVKIPPTEQFGIIAQNYYWSWPIAVFLATTIVGSILRRPYRRLIARLRPASARGSSCWRWPRRRRWRPFPCCDRPTCCPRPTTSGPSAVSSPGPCSTISARSLDELRSAPVPCSSTSAPCATCATPCSPNCNDATSTSCSPPDRPTSPGSATSAATTERPAYLLTLRGGSDAVQLRGRRHAAGVGARTHR